MVNALPAQMPSAISVMVQIPDKGPDWLAFFTSVMGAVAWPLCVAFLFWTYRAEVRRLLSTAKGSIDTPIGRLDFAIRGVEIAAAAVEVDAAAVDVHPAGIAIALDEPPDGPEVESNNAAPLLREKRRDAPGPTRTYSRWLQQRESAYAALAGSTPAEKIVSAARPLEAMVQRLAAYYKVTDELPPVELVEALGGMEVIPPSVANLLMALLQVRQLAVDSGSSFSEFQAREFLKNLQTAKSHLEPLLPADF